MSIGNTKDVGNKGNNFPFQHRVLNGLQAIINDNSDCCKSTQAVLQEISNSLLDISAALALQKRTIKVSSVSNSTGTVAEGAYSISIANVGTTAGTVQGQAFPAGTTLNFDGGVLNNVLSSLAYDATGTTFLITTIE